MEISKSTQTTKTTKCTKIAEKEEEIERGFVTVCNNGTGFTYEVDLSVFLNDELDEILMHEVDYDDYYLIIETIEPAETIIEHGIDRTLFKYLLKKLDIYDISR